ncbi:MAG: glycosyltransferase [Gemmatimonadaceae bacterium]
MISAVAPRYGGPSSAVRGMSRAMVAAGAQVTVATTDADGPGRLTVPHDAPVIEDGIEFRYFRSQLTNSWHFSAGLTRWLSRAIAGFDVVEVHGLFTYSTIPGCRFAAREGVPYVVRPLGTLGAWSLAQRAWKKRPYYALIERRNLAQAAAIHVTAPSEAEEARVLGFGDKAHIIPLGVDVVESVPRRTTRGDGPVQLLFLSRIH